MIKFESVGKTFRDGTAAVVDLSLTVPSDKITVIVGPSGCGKTTTLRMVNRMIEPSSGKITWDGTPLRSKRKTTLRRQMGYVIQSGGLFPHRTVLDNIGTVPGLLGWSKAKMQQRSLDLLGSVGLDRRLAHRYPAQLSGGQQQRVGVARALAADPKVLLMDEPFSAVDPVVRSELHEFFLGLQRDLSKTIILITHDIDEAIKLGDQVAILRVGGKLAQAGTPQQLLEEPADAFVEGFVGRDRGYRSLSFVPASSLELDRVKVVRDVEGHPAAEPTLVLDGNARPIGWADRERPGQVLGLGSTFVPEKDTLRLALDAALTSPYGLAVAVSADTGRYAGVVAASTILAQVTESRSAQVESLSVRDAQARVAAAPAAALAATASPTVAAPAVEATADVEPTTTTAESTSVQPDVPESPTAESRTAEAPDLEPAAAEPAAAEPAVAEPADAPEPPALARPDAEETHEAEPAAEQTHEAEPAAEQTHVGEPPRSTEAATNDTVVLAGTPVDEAGLRSAPDDEPPATAPAARDDETTIRPLRFEEVDEQEAVTPEVDGSSHTDELDDQAHDEDPEAAAETTRGGLR